MTSSPPALIEFSNYGNDWNKYLDGLYEIYKSQIVDAGLTFNELPIRCKFTPMSDGKGFGFWHLISEGEEEESRIPDIRRCERILWVAWMLEQYGSNGDILWHENRRGSSVHVVIWCRVHHFAVILAQRNGYYLLKTAYVTKAHREKTFESEWKKFRGKS